MAGLQGIGGIGESGPAGVLTVQLAGRLDIATAARVRRQLTAAAMWNGRVVVELGEVEHVDSSGLGALVAGWRAARRCGGELLLARPPAQLRALLRATTLDRHIRVCPDVRVIGSAPAP